MSKTQTIRHTLSVYLSSSLVIVQTNEGRDISTPFFRLASHGIHELSRLLVSELHVVSAAAPLPLAIRSHVARVVLTRALQQSAKTASLRDCEHYSGRCDGVQECRFARVWKRQTASSRVKWLNLSRKRCFNDGRSYSRSCGRKRKL